MSDLDGTAAATAVKPKPLAVTKTNIVESSKRDAQNYFKSLSSSAKKPASVLLSKPISTSSFKEEKKVRYSTD